jgi:hypothetical protein
MQFQMPSELDPKIADRLAFGAIVGLRPPQGGKVLCPKQALKQAFLAVIQEAYEVGLLAGQEVRLHESTAHGSADRPSWMDIRLDDTAAMATHGLRLRPVVLRSLIGAGYQCLGDLRRVPGPRLTRLFYVGLKTVRQIRTAIERLEREER